MGKILTWLIAIIAGFIFFKAVKARKQADGANSASPGMENQRSKASQLDANAKTEAMVLCGVCGVHLPASESMTLNNVVSCSALNPCNNKKS